MIKIDNIKVSNFKNILSADLEMNKFNLIVGSNNSGKSNFLKIFYLLDLIINGSVDEVKSFFNRGYSLILNRINPHYSGPKGETSIELKFTDTDYKIIYSYLIFIEYNYDEKEYNIQLKITQESLTYKSSDRTGKPITVFTRIGNNVNFGIEFSKTQILEEVQDHISVVRLLNIIPEKNNPYLEALRLLNYILKTPVFYFSNIELNNIELKETKDNYGRTVSFNVIDEIIRLEKKPVFSILKTILKSILKIDEIKIMTFNTPGHEEEEQKILFFSQFNRLKYITELSDGSILIISLITKILSSNHSIFLIEEPENSLHPKALVEINNFFKSYTEEKQFIIITHSLTLLNTTNPRDIIVANLNEKGQSVFSNISNQKEILKKLKGGYTDFSDVIFFSKTPEEEFE